MSNKEIVKQVAAETAECLACELHRSRKKSVPGAGPDNAEIMFIGEGPGFHENEQGLPFVGAAGDFFNELLAGINMKRDQVFITNVVKCRPPGNRDPMPEELAACESFLEKQIQAINPKVIVTLGRFSMHKFLPEAKISAVHGRPVKVNNRLIMPFYHPAAALHRPSLRSTVEADFAKLKTLIANATDLPEVESLEKSAPEEDKPEQLSLF